MQAYTKHSEPPISCILPSPSILSPTQSILFLLPLLCLTYLPFLVSHFSSWLFGMSAYFFSSFRVPFFSSSSYLIICQNTCRLKRAFVTSSPLPLRPIIRLSPILFLNLRLHNHLFCSCFSSFPSLPPLVSFPSFLPSLPVRTQDREDVG